jgi:ATP-dependent Lon protease
LALGSHIKIMQEFYNSTSDEVIRHPMVPMRDIVIFPYYEGTFVIARPLSVRALEKSLATDHIVFLATQHDVTVETPTPDQIYQVGTLSYIADSSRRLEENTIKIAIKGRERARAVYVEERDGYYLATLRRARVIAESSEQITPLTSRIVLLVEQYLQLSQYTNVDRIQAATQINDFGRMIDRLANLIRFRIEDKQGLLEIYSVRERALQMIELLEGRIDKLNIY